MLKKEQKKITNQFTHGFRWSIFGSIFYETSKIAHQAFLLKAMATSVYGLMGSIFSIIYLTIYLSEFGIYYTLPTFLSVFTKNKNNFKKLFLRIYFLPQIFIISVAGIVATYFYSISFFQNSNSPFLFIIPITIIIESIRIFFRRFLHNVFLSRVTVITETVLMVVFLLSVWVPYLFFGYRMSTNLVFIPYLLNSLFCTIIFTLLIIKYYKKLPNGKCSYDKDLIKRIFQTRFFNYSIQVSKNFFTGNFLTPFFAAQFGMRVAGVFNLANHIAESVKAIIKTTIIFSGNALIANLKTKTLKLKQEAFRLIFRQLNKVIYPLIIFLLINYKSIVSMKGYLDAGQATITLSLLFLFISFSEYFFIIYEQFYIVEEQSFRLFLFKIFEFTMFYMFIVNSNLASPVTTLIGIIVIKLISILAIAITANVLWKVRPSFYLNKKYLIIYFIISILFFCYLNKL